MSAPFASVVLVHRSLVHQDRTFTYRVPGEMQLSIGSLVRVPLGRGRADGVVIGFMDAPDVARTVPIQSPLGPGLDRGVVDLCRWVADQYLSTLGEALATALPERVAAEEAAAPGRSLVVRRAQMAWLRRYRGGRALERALAGGAHAGFSWRPLADEDRGARVASLVAQTAARGRGAIVLLPEVRFAGGVADALRAALGPGVAWLGSDRGARARYRAWLRLRRGEVRVACGGRAAVFAPVHDLGLVVVDDEAHVSYKERRAPRYHARTVAAERARRAGAVLVTVGVPPSVETQAAVERGAMSAVVPARAEELRGRPGVQVVDLRRLPERLAPSAPTLAAARSELRAGRRVVILTHRGGEHATRLTERAFRILGARRPARLDARTDLAELRRAVANADLILATPVVAKDVAPGGVGLVALCEADAALASPEFRAAEEAFAIWWHVGRWARRIVIETAQPSQAAVRALTRWDPAVLYRDEAARRRELGYPPFAGLARVTTPAGRSDEVATQIEARVPGATVLGPVVQGATAILAVRSPVRSALVAGLRPLAGEWRLQGAEIRVDVDPRELLG
jgi:primosomal protein N' (replication factor Y)